MATPGPGPFQSWCQPSTPGVGGCGGQASLQVSDCGTHKWPWSPEAAGPLPALLCPRHVGRGTALLALCPLSSVPCPPCHSVPLACPLGAGGTVPASQFPLDVDQRELRSLSED